MTSNFNPYKLYKLADETDNSVNFNQQEENTTKNITDNVTNPNYKNNTFNTNNEVQSNTLVPEYLQGQVIYNTPKKSAVDNVIHAFDMVKNLALIPIHAGKDRIIDNRAAELNTKEVLGTITEKEKEELDYLENRTDRYNFGIQPSVNHGVEDVAELNKNRFKKYVLQASGEGVVQIADNLKQAGIGGVIGGVAGGVGGAITGLAGGPAGSLANAFNGMKLGWKLGGGVGATKRAWEIETGFAYQEIKAMSNDIGVNIDETLAKRLSLGVGVINAGLEMIGLDSLAKTTPYFNSVLQGAKQRLLKKSITDKAFQQTILKAGERTAQLLANDTAKNTLEYSAVMGEKNAINASLSNVLSDTAVKQTQKKLIKEVTKETAKQGEKILENQSEAVVKAMITEPTTEVLQEVTNILSEELGKQIQGGYSDTVYSQNEDGSYNFNAHVARQNMARAVQAGVMALAPTIIMGGIGRAATARNIAMKNGMTRKEAEEFVNRLENNTGNSILDNDAVLNIAKENAKNKKFNRNVTDRYKELISQGYNEQDAYLGAILTTSQKMGLITDGDLVSYINQNEDTLLEIAAKEYKDDFYTEVEKQKHQEMIDNGYTEEQAFLGSTMLHAFLNANTISEQEKQNVLNSLYFKKETAEQTQDNELVLNQSAMHKNDRTENMKDFVQNIYNKTGLVDDNEMKQVNDKNLYLPKTVVTHDNNRHQLTPDEWQEIADNIDAIFYARKSEENNSLSTNNYKIGIKTKNNNYYGLVIGINDFANYVCTALKFTTKNGVKAFVEDRGKKDKKRKSPSIRPTSQLSDSDSNNTVSVTTYSQDSDDIISYIKEKLNPDVYFQPAYNGSASRFDNFSTDYIGTGEGNQAHGWGLYFAKNKNVSEGYRERLTYGQYDKVLYKNEEITDNTKKRRLKAIYDTPFGGKNFVIEQINDSINEIQSRIDRYKNNLNNETNEYQIETYKGAIKNLENEISDFKKDIDFYKNIDIDDISVERNQGQLYEVDIPEDDVLLDEDKKFSEQPKQVQHAFRNLLNDEYFSYGSDFKQIKEDLVNAINDDLNGKSLYKTLARFDAESASKTLNKYGIKGIKYNGQQDGECYVIFDDKAIDIIKTYYQTGIEDIDNSEKYKNLPQELKDAIDYIFTGKSVYDVKGDEFPNNGKNLNERVFNYYKENFNNVITVDNIGKIKLDKRSIKDSTFHGLSENKANAFAAVPYVLQQGKIVDVSKENNQNEKRYLFVAPITLKGADYFCEVVVKSNKDRQGFYIHEVELKEKLLDVFTAPQGGTSNSSKSLADVFSTAHHGTSTSSKSIIADFVNNFNPNEQLKNKIFNDTDLAGTGRKRHKTIEEIHEDVRARRTGEQYRGYFKSGKYSSIITLAENADATTIIHELGHFFLKTLNDLSAENKDIRDKLVAVDSWLGRVDGEDYTVSQQEKFATGFEAYLYMGKAPSRRIKSAFEMFKEWIKGIVNQDLLKRIDEHNIHAFEVRDVFDRIFNPNNEVYEEKKDKVREILNKVAKIRIGKGLNDTQKRHRECAYQIVSMATGKNIKYLKTILQSNSDSKRILNAKEKIYNLCAECDDKLSVNSYPMEWLEFYGNNENLFQEGNDAELALRAFDDIVNKNYVTEVDEWSYVDNLDAQYQYLIKQYENAKQEDKDIVFSAIMDWIDDIGNTDAMASEIYIEKLGFDLDEIDRLKNMDEFERAKEKILKAAREIAYNTPNKDEQFRKTVLAVLNGLKFLTLSDKMKLAANILECPNLTFLEARIDSIMDIAKTMLEVNERKKLYRLIQDEIAGTKNIKQNNRMVGKYDYRTNKLFEQLRVLDKMTREQLQEWLDANDAFEEIKETEENKKSELESEFDKKLKRRYARIKSESAADIDVEILKGMYDDLRKIKLTARNVKNEQELYDRLERINERDEVLKVLRQRKDNENIVKKGYLNLFANWESSLNTIFNLDIRNKYSALLKETKADGWAFEQKSKFEDDIAKIYGLRGWNFDKEVLKNLKTTFKVEQYTYRPARNGEYIVTPVTVTMNKMEILLAYMWDKNEVLHERMVNQFGEEQLFDLFDELTPHDKALGDLMLKRINEFYPQDNKVFIKKYGIDLPKVQAYFPSVADRFNERDLLTDYRQRSTAPTFTKERSASTFIPLKFSNPISMFYKHIDDMSKFIYMSDIGDRINHVFRDNVVQKEIKERFGQRALRTFNQNMENFLYPQYRQSDELLRFLNSFITNIIASNVAIRPVIAVKQLLSACNYSTEMPADLWVKGFMNCLLHPKATIDYMKKIPYLNARFNMGGSDEFSKNMIDNMHTSSLKKLQNLLMFNVRIGDMGAIMFGGKPYIDYLINNEGLTEQEAIDKFILQTQRTQQSSAISSLSVWQQNANTNPIWKMLTAYKNTANQYVRLCVDSVINAMNGDVSWKYAGKNLFMYLWLQPFLYICATKLGLLRYFNTGDDDGLKQDFMSSLFDWNKTALAIIGDVLQNVQDAVITGEVSRLYSSNEILNNLGKAMYDLLTDGVQTEDVVSVIAFLLNTKVRVPVESVMDMASCAGDIVAGEFQKGFLKLMGYSSYRAAYAMGEDKEYLKQKRKETRKKKNKRKLDK